MTEAERNDLRRLAELSGMETTAEDREEYRQWAGGTLIGARILRDLFYTLAIIAEARKVMEPFAKALDKLHISESQIDECTIISAEIFGSALIATVGEFRAARDFLSRHKGERDALAPSPPAETAEERQAKIVKWLRQRGDHHSASAKLHASVHEPTLASYHEALASAINIAADMIERNDYDKEPTDGR